MAVGNSALILWMKGPAWYLWLQSCPPAPARSSLHKPGRDALCFPLAPICCCCCCCFRTVIGTISSTSATPSDKSCSTSRRNSDAWSGRFAGARFRRHVFLHYITWACAPKGQPGCEGALTSEQFRLAASHSAAPQHPNRQILLILGGIGGENTLICRPHVCCWQW